MHVAVFIYSLGRHGTVGIQSLLPVNMVQSPAQGTASLPNHSNGPASSPALLNLVDLTCQILAGLCNQHR
jgi:hypothetical protein